MNLDLQIKDNFLPTDLFQKLSVYCTTLDYGEGIKYGEGTKYDKDQHVFYSNNIHKDDDLLKDLEQSIIKHFRVGIKNLHLAAFTLVNTKEALPHVDKLQFPTEKHLIIYLNGDSKLNAGTGFYESSDDGFDLNTAIGCYPNRAVLFNASDCYHSPLLYTAKNNIPRFAVIIWFEPEIDL